VGRQLSRKETIIWLLETLDEARSTGTAAGEGTVDKGDRLLLLGALYKKGSYRQLEFVLQGMRSAETTFAGYPLPRLAFHVVGWFCAPTRIGKRCTEERCKRLECKNPAHQGSAVVRAPANNIDKALAGVGVDFIDRLWERSNFAPFLPPEYLSLVA
jgi:hypothetical protein